FRDIAAAGIRGAMFGEMKMLGIAAEARMLHATRGVNTHRGAIFGMGLVCAAAGWCLARRGSAGDAELRATLRRWRYDLRTPSPDGDAAPLHGEAPSHGHVAVLRHGVDGARGEAARAFPSVFRCALPALRAALARGANAQQAQLHALFALMAQVADTNVLYRGGIDGLQVMRAAAQRFLAQGSVFASGSSVRAVELHRHFCALGLSPGGCADLLGVTCFMQRVQTGEFPGNSSARGPRAPDVAGRAARAR
ncbi:MAG: triphosphoribosyl-dephospho-CoA synthase, partial [Casimicrobiaceae bacterium]